MWEQQCRQSSAGYAVYVATPCTITGAGSPCTPQSTLAEAAAAIVSASEDQGALSLYMNVHTNSSFIANGNVPLGFIRGQLQPGLAVPYPQSITTQRASSTLYFRAALSAAIGLSTSSTGDAVLALYPDNTWKLRVSIQLALSDALVGDQTFPGIHIHAGDSTTNGPILVGFCGSSGLPYFGTPLTACAAPAIGPITSNTQSYTFTQNYEIGSACVVTGSGSPCYNGGVDQDLNSAAMLLRSSTNSDLFYLNIHTPTHLPGLIRGQLIFQDVTDFSTLI
eukprot:TRINITY_DN10771_c0_g1_i1.p1 TRINITY_DN10771_c0_g1~~TRINITY_DN10771_c0_g1_i1.p1  ORF type:complete len:279 (+),score=51.50 TRINITY_DN10771_c0_g1_i1:407-1243(+)